MYRSRMNWTNDDFPYLINVQIHEYDIKSAGLSALIEKGVISPEKAEALKRMNKTKRNITIGHLMRRDKGMTRAINEALIEARAQFIESNELTSEDILSVKRDAVFVIGKTVEHRVFGQYEFILKNTYSSYVKLNKKEFYYSSRGSYLDVKGISDKVRENQKDYFLNDIRIIMRSAERLNPQQMFRHLKKYRSEYLGRKLPIETYRSIDSGTFRVGKFEFDIPPSKDLYDQLDYMENYRKYIIPLIQALI